MNSTTRKQATRFCVVKIVLSMMLGRKVGQHGVVAFTKHAATSRNTINAVAAFRQRLQRPPLEFRPSVALYSTTSSPSSASDRSAISKSRLPFRMPRNSPDDSAITINTSSSSSLSWHRLGLLTELCDCLTDELKLPEPTPVQSLVIPQLLLQQAAAPDQQESLAFLAATGSGKTLAYVLPMMQQLKQQEIFEGYERRPKRPRVLILAPTRELAFQITTVVKSLSHTVKLSTQALVGGQDKGIQRKSLESRPVDVVVATPGRLLYHWKNNNIFLGNIRTVVLDEMDTMLEQGFARELREILYPLLYSASAKEIDADTSNAQPAVKETAPHIIMTSATMTQTIQKLLGDNPKTSKLSIGAKRLHSTVGGGENPASDASMYTKLKLPKMKILAAPGLHKAVPRLEQVFVDVGNTDKISLLLDVVASRKSKATIIFCNTASSVRAVQYALSEARIESIGYHGELNSVTRTENLQKFRKAARKASLDGDRDDFDEFNDFADDELNQDANILVCTDIAARGLDIPEVDFVVMFDFPLNAMDYLHRSGRTARGSGKGKVTALVTKRDRVLASAIEQAVLRGEPLDGLSSRKSDYQPGARFGVKAKPKPTKSVSQRRRGVGTRRS